ncbi:anti-sigma factor [Aneurinibacillus sp. REN35]|uniref:anti-sigma factor n=1 Tax=Aneurinibacillus sp. REN35 TaxID=3237286 RepID=UPI0035275E8D
MKCPNEGFLQSYLDGEVDREARKRFSSHLQHCTACRSRMEEIKKLEQWAELALQEALPQPSAEDVQIDTEAAWKRFEKRIQSPSSITTRKREGKSMNKSYKKLLTGAAAAGIVLGSFTIPQVQVAASSFLSIFRVDQVEMVKLTQTDISEIENWMANGENGVKEIKGIGKVWIDEKDAEQQAQQHFNKAEEAEKAGHAIPAAPKGFAFAGLDISPTFQIHAQLDTEKANALLKQVKAKTFFDEKLDNKPFSIAVPEMKNYHFNSEATSKNGPVSQLNYGIVGAPEIKVPEEVNMDELRNTLLSLPFIPQNVKQQLAGIKDWQRTLPIPYVEDSKNQMRSVTVQGVKGFAYKTEYQTFLIWQKGDKIHHLEMYDDKKEKSIDALIALANQLQ